MKRYLLVILFLVLAASGIYIYLSKGEIALFNDSSAYSAVPVSSPFFLEVSSARDLSPSNPVLGELEAAGVGKSWFQFLHDADSLIGIHDHLTKSFLNNPFILAYGVSGRNQLVPLIIKKAESSGQQKMAENFFQALYPENRFEYKKKEYGQFLINEISRVSSAGSLFYSFADGLLLISPRSILVEQSIRQMENPGLQKNPFFREVNKAMGTKGISLFINHQYIQGFFGNILNRATVEKVDEFGSALRFQPISIASKFKDYAGWSGLDFRMGNNQILMNGISAADDSLNHFLAVFQDQQPVRYKAEYMLPQNTAFFCVYAFSGKKSFFEGLESFFAHSPDYYHREERMKRFERGMRADVRKVFGELVRDEVVVAATTIPVNPQNKTVYFIMNTNGKAGAEAQLNKLLENYAARSGSELSELKSDFKVDSEISFPVYRFPYPSFPGLWLGSPFTMAEARFVSFIDSYMVFSNSEKGLHEYLRNMVLGTTLAKDLRYQGFKAGTSNRANIHVFVDVNKIYGYRKELFAESVVKPVDNREESIRKFGMINWQVLREKNRFSNNLAIAYLPNDGKEAQTTWQSMIGSNIIMKPQITTNPLLTTDREIIFQDEQHNLVQVSSSGRIRWSIPVAGPVLGEVHQIDFFKNGRFQYLFNTAGKIYLIDRNGNNVQGFPITMTSPATNGVSVFDYDNNRNYRYFVACEDRKIHAFDHAGKPIKGWKFESTDNLVVSPVQHFKVEGKDYIVFKDKSAIYMLDRQGEVRMAPSVKFENSGNPLFLYTKDKPRIVATDITGKVHYIYFDGKTEERKTARFSGNHFFAVDDLDGNGVADFIFIDGNELTVMDEKGKKLFSKKHSNMLKYMPRIYSFSSNLKKVGVVDAALNRIYLYEPDGKLHEGFPLQGNSEFSIGKLSNNSDKVNLLVGSEGGLLFNYTLN
jgi:hypothetical protein